MTTHRLLSLCTKIGSGATPRGGKETYSQSGEISLIRSQNVLDLSFSTDGLVYISAAQAKLLDSVTIQPNDVLINITGDSVGRVCSVPEYVGEARVNQHVAILRADEKRLSATYLRYYLVNPSMKRKLLTMASVGATRNALTKVMLDNLEISIPTYRQQKRIAEILSSLDDKIELNRQMNQTLEETAQAMFKHHFVDGVDRDNLPEGWRIFKLGELIDSVSITHKFPKPEIIFLNTSDILEGSVLISNYSDVDSLPGQAKKRICKGDILYSEIRPGNKRYAYVDFNAEDYVVSTKLMVLRSKCIVDSIFPYFFLTQQSTIKYLQNIAESRSGTFPQITFEQIKIIELTLPSLDKVQQFTSDILKPNYDLILSNNKEIERLIEVRDYLLPKLIAGEIIPAELKQLEQAL